MRDCNAVNVVLLLTKLENHFSHDSSMVYANYILILFELFMVKKREKLQPGADVLVLQ